MTSLTQSRSFGASPRTAVAAVRTGRWDALKPRWVRISNRGIVLWTAVLIFFGSFALLPFIGKEFSPQVDESFISLRLNTPVGSSLEYTNAKVLEVEQALKRHAYNISLAAQELGLTRASLYRRMEKHGL